MAYDFGQQILGAISQTLDRNEQQRQYNINDQWRKYALSQDLTDREKQRVFLHGERLGGEEHEDVMQGAGFKHAKGMQEALFKENRWDKTHGQTFDLMTGKFGFGDFTNMGDSVPATEFGLNAVMKSGAFMSKKPGVNYPRADLPEKIQMTKYLPGYGGMLGRFYDQWNLSTTGDQRRAMQSREAAAERKLQKDPLWWYKTQMAQRNGLLAPTLDPSALLYNFE